MNDDWKKNSEGVRPQVTDRSIAKPPPAKSIAKQIPASAVKEKNVGKSEPEIVAQARRATGNSNDIDHGQEIAAQLPNSKPTVEDDESPSIFRGLDQERAFIHLDDDRLLDEARRTAALADDQTPLMLLNRTVLRSVMRNKNLRTAHLIAIRWFLGRYKQSKWMRRQDRGLYPERLGIALLSGWSKGQDFAYCGMAGRLCGETDYCPRCAYFKKAKRVLNEHEDLFEQKRPNGSPLYFYAVTPSFEFRAAHAGVHFVIEKENRQEGRSAKIDHWQPFKGMDDFDPLTADHDVGPVNPISLAFRVLFDFAGRLQRRKHVEGILAHRQIAWHFFEKANYPHHLTPHAHFLVVTNRPLAIADGYRMLWCFQNAREGYGCGRSQYPDLHIEALTSQAEINRWICYIFLPMDFVRPYLRAAKQVTNFPDLNYEVDDRVFQGGNVILSQPSPRRYGILSARGNGYVGRITVTQQREAEEAERKERKTRRSQPAPPSKNYLHKSALLQEFAVNESA